MMLPSSIYSTPGMRAFGDAGCVPEDDPQVPGLQIAFVARSAIISKVRAPCFGFLTTRNRGSSSPIRNAFLALRLVHMHDKPDIVAVEGVWLLDKGDFAEYYGDILRDMCATDPSTKETFDNELIVDANWRDMGGFAQFEPSIKVLRVAGADADGDAVGPLAAIFRKNPYRKKGAPPSSPRPSTALPLLCSLAHNPTPSCVSRLDAP
jgi:hypothetical protein